MGSHTLLAYPVAARLGLTKNAPIAMVTAVVSLLVLVGVSATVEGATGLPLWAGPVTRPTRSNRNSCGGCTR